MTHGAELAGVVGAADHQGALLARDVAAIRSLRLERVLVDAVTASPDRLENPT